jgi:hypothetical protein
VFAERCQLPQDRVFLQNLRWLPNTSPLPCPCSASAHLPVLALASVGNVLLPDLLVSSRIGEGLGQNAPPPSTL